MNYLVDTCVISELIKSSPSKSVIDWINCIDESNLYLSVITLGEIQKGVVKLPDGHKKIKLQNWIDNDLSYRFKGRIISIDLSISIMWGIILSKAEKIGKKLPAIDTLISATAIDKNMILVTRNTKDMIESGAKILDPFI